MFMKSYAPNRWEPSIEVIMKIVGGLFFFFFFFFFLGGGGVRVDVKVDEELNLL